jgi:DNA-binding response OmpR family regulator
MRLDLRGKKFLVIDDSPQMRSSLRKMVQSFGAANVDEAGDGEESVRKIRKLKYDVILCDYALGDGKDGQQILEEAKHHHLIKYSTIFMMITAETTAEMVMGAVEYHSDDYLAKPFTREVLGRRLERLIQRKRDFDDIEAAIHKRQYDQALTLCNDHIERGPRNLLEFLRFKSNLCLRLGRYAHVMDVCEQVLAMRDIPWAMLDMAQALFHSGRLIQARDMLDDLLEANNASVAGLDWLARCQQALGDNHGAQSSLARAAALSPRSVLRQRALGATAHRNGDLDTAEKAYGRAVRLGRHSIYHCPSDQANLIKVLLDKDAPSRALKALDGLVGACKGNPAGAMLSHAVRAIVYKRLNRVEDARQAVAAGIALYAEMGVRTPPETALEVAAACLALDRLDAGADVIKDVVRNRHDDATVLERAASVFDRSAYGDRGRDIIDRARQEIFSINIKGTSLVAQDRLREAVDFFDKAADELPDNKTINFNASQVMLTYMERHGRDDKLLYRARRYLDRLQQLDPGNAEHQHLQNRYRSLAHPC